MKKLINYIFVVLLLVSCEKSKNKSLTIEGRLMSGCNTPAANKEGSIRTYDALSGPGIVLDFITDDNGYFKISHNEKGSISKFYVNVEGGSDVLRVHYYPEDHKKLGDIYINPFPTNFIISLDVQNSYTSNDTLAIRDYSSSDPFAQRLIPGPFTNGFLDSVVNDYYNLFPISRSSVTNGNTPTHSVIFYLRSLPNYIGDKQKESFSIAPICSGEFAEVELVIE